MTDCRFSLVDLRRKIERERICTYIITRQPEEDYQAEAMTVLLGSPWIEVRYNPFVHAKVYVAMSRREADSFGLLVKGLRLAATVWSPNHHFGNLWIDERALQLIFHALVKLSATEIKPGVSSVYLRINREALPVL